MSDLDGRGVIAMRRVLGGAAFAPDLTGGAAPEWMAAAVCASTDPEVFFPEKGGSTREAKRICRGTKDLPGCPVRAECLTFALEHQERFGIWGGLSERERRRAVSGKVVEVADRRFDEGECPVCLRHFRSVRSHLATKASCRERGAA